MKELKSAQEFKALMNSGKSVLLDVYSETCGPCQMLMPVLEELSEEYKHKAEVVKINSGNPDVQSVMNLLQVRSVPTLFFIKDGINEHTLQGAHAKKIIKRGLDDII